MKKFSVKFTQGLLMLHRQRVM